MSEPFIWDVSNTVQFRQLTDKHSFPLARRYLIGKTIEKVYNRETRKQDIFVAGYNPTDLRSLFTVQLSPAWVMGAHESVVTLYHASHERFNLGINLPIKWLATGGVAAQAIHNLKSGDGYRVTLPRSNKHG